MADFCRRCAAEFWGVEDSTDITGPRWALCEGCGVHYFDKLGLRVCERPTPSEGEVSATACDDCLDVFDRGTL